MSNVVVKADSINTATNQRITTLLLTRFPYTLIQELGTHRQLYALGVGCPVNVFDENISRNSASTRAIPVKRMIDYVLSDPFVPRFTRHQKGMSGDEESVTMGFLTKAEATWNQAMQVMVSACRLLAEDDVHKQHINDLLKVFLRIPILVTATEWDNFLRLRTDKTCRVEFREYAKEIKAALEQSVPTPLAPGEWHIPFGDNLPADVTHAQRLMAAAARCARLSYASHDGDHSLQSQLLLADQLLYDGHLSPFEHIAMAVSESLPEGINLPKARLHDGTIVNTRNLRGWYSLRAMVEDDYF